jgi:hypothetical protein
VANETNKHVGGKDMIILGVLFSRSEMIFSAIIMLAIGIVPAIIAERRGYNWRFWILSAGLLGLIIIFFLPDTHKEETPEATAKKQKFGNSIGIVLTVIAIMYILLPLGL